ncbi:hypothetical protein HDU77_007560 [Chytriomyces hyalinus]|nr:hypothetical protein HDU77_007560 [Chytriomyces hyalinus]
MSDEIPSDGPRVSASSLLGPGEVGESQARDKEKERDTDRPSEKDNFVSILTTSVAQSGGIAFTDAMAIAGRRPPSPMFPSSSGHSRQASPSQSNKQVHLAPVATPTNTTSNTNPQFQYQDFNQFTASSDALNASNSFPQIPSQTTPTQSRSADKIPRSRSPSARAPSPSGAGLQPSSRSPTYTPITPVMHNRSQSPTLFANPLPKTSKIASLNPTTDRDTSMPQGPPLVQVPATLLDAATVMVTKRWTNPIHFHEIPQIDSVQDALQKSFSFNSGARPVRRLMSLHDAQMKLGKSATSTQILHLLIESHSYRAIAQLAASVIPTLSPHALDDICDWWFVRLVALEKLKFLDVLAVEVEVLQPGDAVVSVGSAYGEDVNTVMASNGRVKNPVSWSIKMFWAREPSIRGLTREAIDRTYTLLHSATLALNSKETDAVAKSLWKSRILNIHILLVDLLLELRDYRLASILLMSMISANPTDAHILSALFRIKLQTGNVHEAREISLHIERILLKDRQEAASSLQSDQDQTQPSATLYTKPDLILTNRALLAAALGDWSLATTHLQQLLEHIRSTAPSETSPSSASSAAAAAVASTTTTRNALAIVINNLSIAHLYNGTTNASQSLQLFESMAVELPHVMGTCAPLLFNLATVYDLVDASMDRKRRLLGGLVAVRAGDDLDTVCLKLG